MSKLIEKGLEKIGITETPIQVEFFSQSCFPLYKIFFQNRSPILVKIASPELMGEVEFNSIQFLEDKNISVPKLYGFYSEGNYSLLYMEFIERINSEKTFFKDTLLKLYSIENQKFGFYNDNYIGSLVQKNSFYSNFNSYFWESRLEVQLKISIENKLLSTKFANDLEKLFSKLCNIWNLNSFTPRLIHGDLWSGNVLFSKQKVYLIDPSLSFGNLEQDLSMLELFGSPLDLKTRTEILSTFQQDIDFEERIHFWQIYPLLVHVNLFGGSYISELNSKIKSYT
jgi:fructosamine-3-kinase